MLRRRIAALAPVLAGALLVMSLGRSGPTAGAQPPGTPEFPTPPPTQPFPTLPPDVPTPAPFTPTPTIGPTDTPRTPETPTADPSPSTTPDEPTPTRPVATATPVWAFVPYAIKAHDTDWEFPTPDFAGGPAIEGQPGGAGYRAPASWLSAPGPDGRDGS